MSKIVRVQGGDYKLIVGTTNSINNIEFDTAPFPNWLPSKRYSASDIVKYQQAIYRAKLDLPSAGITPSNNTYWELAQPGKVTITGDLEVLGNTTTIDSETLIIKDNIVYLNVGETGAGVSTLGVTSGISIDRGTLPDVNFFWDERIDQFVLVDSTYTPTGLVTPDNLRDSIKSLAINGVNAGSGNFTVSIQGQGVIQVTGTDNYETRVLKYNVLDVILDISTVTRNSNEATLFTTTPHNLTVGDYVDIQCITNNTFSGNLVTVTATPSPVSFKYSNTGVNVPAIPASGTVRPNPIRNDDYIPNIRAVADYVRSSAAFFVPTKIQELDTKVEVKDFDVSGVSEITLTVNGVEKAVANSNGLTVGNININNNNISNIATDNILFDSVLSIPNKSDTPTTPTTGHVKLYSKSLPGTGGTGLYFVNTVGTNDELISKTKALLYSLIL
jgi:hypothetical protein